MALTWASSPLNKAEAHVVATHWDDLIENLAPPTTAWTWTETELEPKTKHRLKAEGLIEPVPGGRWRAAERLWLDVIDRVGDDETIGAGARGQELLVEPAGVADDDSRLLAEPAPSPLTSEPEQSTLTGDTVETVNNGRDRWKENLAKTKQGDGDEDVVDAAQLRLTFFSSGQTHLDAWVEAVGATDPLSA